MERIVRIERQDKRRDGQASTPDEIDSTVALIQALIQLGLQAVGEALDAEVTALAGIRYCRRGGQSDVVPWGSNAARSIWPIRNDLSPCLECATDGEPRDRPHEQLQRPRAADAGLLGKILVGPDLSAGQSLCGGGTRSVRTQCLLCSPAASSGPAPAPCRPSASGVWTGTSSSPWSSPCGITLQRQKKILGFVQTVAPSAGVFPVLGISLTTTNGLESLGAQLPAHRPGGSLVRVGPETPLGGQCADPHRAAPAEDERLPASAPAPDGTTDRDPTQVRDRNTDRLAQGSRGLP